MRTDKDRPSTWVVHQSQLCQNCQATCCTMPVEVSLADLIQLRVVQAGEWEQMGPRKFTRALQARGVIKTYRSSTDLFELQARPNGECQFLSPTTRLCAVYERRPQVCRDFPKVGPRPGFCPYQKK